jgi:hypothetical protein
LIPLPPATPKARVVKYIHVHGCIHYVINKTYADLFGTPCGYAILKDEKLSLGTPDDQFKFLIYAFDVLYGGILASGYKKRLLAVSN